MIEYLNKVDLTDYTLIVPSVSVGNVGQLAVDLLITSLNLKKLAYVWHSSVVPMAGCDPFGKGNTISTGCEVFYSERLRLAAMQIRSGVLRSRNDFSQFMCNWVKEENMKQVIILTGSSAHERRDQQLLGRPLRYVFCPLTTEAEERNALARQWKKLESKEIHSCMNAKQGSDISYIPGSGMSLKLFQCFMKSKIPCSILIEFCSDGNNAPDAYILADYLNEWLRLKDSCGIDEWLSPPSWILMFGLLPPSEIFN